MNWQLSSIGRVGAGTSSFHPLGELALELEDFIHWASWRWNWQLSSIGRVGAGTGRFHPLGELAQDAFACFSLSLEKGKAMEKIRFPVRPG